MPSDKSRRIPKYRLNKTSGRAVVTLNGVDHWLGKYDSPESREKYDRLLAEWLASGRQSSKASTPDLTIIELIARFWSHVEAFYRKPDGSLSGEAENYRLALRPLKELYGSSLAAEFGPMTFRAVREKAIQIGWCRSHLNRQMGRIKHMFEWAVSEELLPPAVHQSLVTVKGLRRGKTDARESERVRPIPDPQIDAIRPFVSRQVWAMIELQRTTGMRPGEVIAMRACDIEMTGETWTYVPAHHKTEHHGHDRILYLGNRCQELLRPFITPSMSKHLFSPAAAEAERLEALHAARKTPLSCGNRPGTNRVRRRSAAPGDRYTVASYRRAIERGCDQAFPPPPPLARERETRSQWKSRLTKEQKTELAKWRRQHRWHPHQLRHTAGTRFRKEFGLDVAKVLLGHSTLTATQVYAEQDQEKARKVMALVG